MYARRLLTCVAVSVLAHLLFAGSVARLPERAVMQRPQRVEVSIVAPPPPPPPPPPVPVEPLELPPSPPPPEATPKPRAVPPKVPSQLAVVPSELPPSDAPPTERPAIAPGPAGVPVFGLSLESTSSAGNGPAVPVGNTLLAPGKGPVGAPLPPAPAYEVTRMPLPLGRCTGRYTEAARSAAIEGTVVLDLVVGEDGTAREITVVQGLGHGLDEAAVAALQGCRFSPGERARLPVPVRVRGFKIRFFLQDGE